MPRANCLQGAVYIPNLLKHNLLVQQRVFSFFIDEMRQSYSKDTENENEKCSAGGCSKDHRMAKMVNSVIQCNMNHQAMTMSFLILWRLLEKTHTYFGALSLCKRL